MEYLLLIGGLAVLIGGGEVLVRGAVGIAAKFKLSPLVIGMTIVSFGTSAPELIVSLKAALNGFPEIAIGNVVGSNIANIALVLGLTAIVLPIPVAVATLKRDWPIMMFISLLFFVFILNGILDNWEGFIFVGLLLGYIIYQLKSSKNKEEETEIIKQHIFASILFITVGVIGLAFGADWLVQGAVTIAKNFGVSEHVISVTIVAFGTSVPELVTSLVAAVKKQMDISVGNLIGSNIFNILAVLGITAIFKEIPISETVISNDIFWVLGTSFILLPLMLNYKISRWKGALLFLSYLLYVFFLLQSI
ncbi:MAG TPA: calcium/sodium antiporter [Vicingaceae bacterium]